MASPLRSWTALDFERLDLELLRAGIRGEDRDGLTLRQVCLALGIEEGAGHGQTQTDTDGHGRTRTVFHGFAEAEAERQRRVAERGKKKTTNDTDDTND